MAYWGSGAASCDYAFDQISVYVFQIKQRMFEDMENVLQKSYPEQSIVASVKCLRLLWEGFPKCVRLHFGRRDLERCGQSFELWCTTLAARLPAEHRAAIRSEAMLEFSLFRETVLAFADKTVAAKLMAQEGCRRGEPHPNPPAPTLQTRF